MGDIRPNTGTLSFEDIRAAYNTIHQTNISNTGAALSISDFHGKYLTSSATALAISSSSTCSLDAVFAGKRFANAQILAESTTATAILVAEKETRFRIHIAAASDTFKVTLENVIGHTSGTPDCKIGLSDATDNSTVLYALTDGDNEVLEYTPSTGKIFIYGLNTGGKPSSPTATLSNGDPSTYSNSATDFVLHVGGFDSNQAGNFSAVRAADVHASGGGGSSSNATYWLYLHDTGGNGGGGMFELAPTGTTDLLTPTDLGNFAHSNGNGGSALSISSNAAQLADGAGYDYDDMNTELPCFSYSLPVPDSGSTTVYDLLPYDDGGAGGDSYEFRWGIAPENGGMLQFGGIGGPENSDLFSDVRSATASFWGGSGKVITLTLSPDGSGSIGTRD